MKMRTMMDLYGHLLRDIYYAENQLIKQLPKLIKHVSDIHLQKTLKNHLLETKVQTERLEQIFKLLGIPARGEKCPAMEGLLAEAHELSEKAETNVIDLTVTAACRKIEHYEIGSYRTLIEIAKMLGYVEHIKILKDILKQEKAADVHLVSATHNLITSNQKRATA